MEGWRPRACGGACARVKFDPPSSPGHWAIDRPVTEADTTPQLIEGQSMVKVARQLGITFGSFVVAWLAVLLVARWLFGSGNILVWVFAAVVAAGVYLEILRRDRRAG